jgi:hypothetical protein
MPRRPLLLLLRGNQILSEAVGQDFKGKPKMVPQANKKRVKVKSLTLLRSCQFSSIFYEQIILRFTIIMSRRNYLDLNCLPGERWFLSRVF